MRRIAIINQKGGVGKTTTCANLGSALARMGRRVVVVDMDPQANLSLHLGAELLGDEPSTYTVLTGATPFEAALRPTTTDGLRIAASHIDLSGAELELASAISRETLLRDAIDDWERAARERSGEAPADYVLIDCPPSLGLLSVNGLAAAREVIIAVQTEFFALQGMSKLVEVVQLLRRRLNPELTIAGILPCLYDNRLRLAREVLAEVRQYFPGQVFETSIRSNVKLAEAPSHGRTIFEYDPACTGARDHLALAEELTTQESRDHDLAERDLPRPQVEELGARLVAMTREHRSQTSSAEPPPSTSSGPSKPRAGGTPESMPECQAEPQPESQAASPSGPPSGAPQPPIASREPESSPQVPVGTVATLDPPPPEDKPKEDDAPREEPLPEVDVPRPDAAAGEEPEADPEPPKLPEAVGTEPPVAADEPADEPAAEPADGPAEVVVEHNYADNFGEDRPRMPHRFGPGAWGLRKKR